MRFVGLGMGVRGKHGWGTALQAGR